MRWCAINAAAGQIPAFAIRALSFFGVVVALTVKASGLPAFLSRFNCAC